MVSKIIGRVVSSIISVCLAWVWAVQCAGLIGAVIPSLDSIPSTTLMIRVITIVVSVVAFILIWSGIMNLSKSKGIKVTSGIISAYFLTLIAITILYMVIIGDLKYVMLAEVVGAWVIWFVILSALSSMRKKVEEADKSVSEMSDSIEKSIHNTER